MSDLDTTKPKKRKQKRYTSEQEILDAIDAQHKHWLIDNYVDECERKGEGCYDHAHFENEQAAWRAIGRIESSKLPKLKNALADYRTETFSFTEDKAVVLENL